MKVNIDTNVVVSAALRDRDPETIILFVVQQPDFQWMVSEPIVKEYKEVLSLTLQEARLRCMELES